MFNSKKYNAGIIILIFIIYFYTIFTMIERQSISSGVEYKNVVVYSGIPINFENNSSDSVIVNSYTNTIKSRETLDKNIAYTLKIGQYNKIVQKQMVTKDLKVLVVVKILFLGFLTIIISFVLIELFHILLSDKPLSSFRLSHVTGNSDIFFMVFVPTISIATILILGVLFGSIV